MKNESIDFFKLTPAFGAATRMRRILCISIIEICISIATANVENE